MYPNFKLYQYLKENVVLTIDVCKKYIYDCKIKESQLSLLHLKHFLVSKLTVVFQTKFKLKAERVQFRLAD